MLKTGARYTVRADGEVLSRHRTPTGALQRLAALRAAAERKGVECAAAIHEEPSGRVLDLSLRGHPTSVKGLDMVLYRATLAEAILTGRTIGEVFNEMMASRMAARRGTE